MTKKLWSVSVQLEIEMPVWAETPEEAEEIALANYEEEPSWCKDNAMVIAGEPLANTPAAFRGCIPWGAPNDETCERLCEDASR